MQDYKQHMEDKMPLSKVEKEGKAKGAAKANNRKDIALNALQVKLIKAN